MSARWQCATHCATRARLRNAPIASAPLQPGPAPRGRAYLRLDFGGRAVLLVAFAAQFAPPGEVALALHRILGRHLQVPLLRRHLCLRLGLLGAWRSPFVPILGRHERTGRRLRRRRAVGWEGPLGGRQLQRPVVLLLGLGRGRRRQALPLVQRLPRRVIVRLQRQAVVRRLERGLLLLAHVARSCQRPPVPEALALAERHGVRPHVERPEGRERRVAHLPAPPRGGRAAHAH